MVGTHVAPTLPPSLPGAGGLGGLGNLKRPAFKSSLDFDGGASTAHVCIYGPPSTGKTEAIAYLVQQGHNVLYLDLDHNTAPFTALNEEELTRLHYVSIADNPFLPNAVPTLIELFEKGSVSVCEQHGVKDCPVCRGDGSDFVIVDIKKLPKNTIWVLDSATRVASSADAIMRMKLKMTPWDKAEHDYHNGMWSIMNIMRSGMTAMGRPTVTLTHVTDMYQSRGETQFPQHLVPTMGSRRVSWEAGKDFSYTWKTNTSAPTSYTHVSGSLPAFATSRGREKEFTGKPLKEALALLFAPLLKK